MPEKPSSELKKKSVEFPTEGVRKSSADRFPTTTYDAPSDQSLQVLTFVVREESLLQPRWEVPSVFENPGSVLSRTERNSRWTASRSERMRFRVDSCSQSTSWGRRTRTFHLDGDMAQLDYPLPKPSVLEPCLQSRLLRAKGHLSVASSQESCREERRAE